MQLCCLQSSLQWPDYGWSEPPHPPRRRFALFYFVLCDSVGFVVLGPHRLTFDVPPQRASEVSATAKSTAATPVNPPRCDGAALQNAAPCSPGSDLLLPHRSQVAEAALASTCCCKLKSSKPAPYLPTSSIWSN